MKFAIRASLLFALLGAAFAQNYYPQGLIQHVIIVIQENRTPTNLFFTDQTLISRGAHVQPPGNPPAGSCHGTQIPLTGMEMSAFCANPDHSHYTAWTDTCDNANGGPCKMDGACDVSVTQHPCPNPVQNAPYTYALNSTFDGVNGILDPYFHIAENYGFANWMFQTNQGPSYPAHQFSFRAPRRLRTTMATRVSTGSGLSRRIRYL